MENAQTFLRQTRRGFTLIELLVVIAIIAILAAILFPVFQKVRENARRTTCQSNQKQLALAILQYNQDYDEKYPQSNLQALAKQVGWANLIEPYIKSVDAYHCPDMPGAAETSLDLGAASVTYNYNTMLGYATYSLMDAYNMSDGGQSLAVLQQPSSTIMLMEAFPYDASSGRPYGIGYQCSGLIVPQHLVQGSGYDGSVCGDPALNYSSTGYSSSANNGAVQVHNGGGDYAFADGHVKYYRPEKIYGGATLFSVSGDNPTFHLHD